MLSVKHGKALVTRGTIESIVKKSLCFFLGLFGHVFLGHLQGFQNVLVTRLYGRWFWWRGTPPFRLQEPDFMTWWWECPHCRFPYPVQVGIGGFST